MVHYFSLFEFYFETEYWDVNYDYDYCVSIQNASSDTLYLHMYIPSFYSVFEGFFMAFMLFPLKIIHVLEFWYFQIVLEYICWKEGKSELNGVIKRSPDGVSFFATLKYHKLSFWQFKCCLCWLLLGLSNQVIIIN